jgi:hypothetical protein
MFAGLADGWEIVADSLDALAIISATIFISERVDFHMAIIAHTPSVAVAEHVHGTCCQERDQEQTGHNFRERHEFHGNGR